MDKCKDCGDILGSNSLCRRCKFVGNGGSETGFEFELRREQRRTLYSIGSDYWRCPTTKKILQAHSHDDKVLCDCGKTNPKLIAASPKSNEVHSGVTVHVKRFLKSATVDEYLEQKDRDEAIRDRKTNRG